jgi:hypothetical protein
VAPQPIELSGAVPAQPIGPQHAYSCMPIYINETTSTGFFAPAGAGVELADDLHTTSEGVEAICALDFGYHKPSAGVVDATITFYDNDAADGSVGSVLAGPFLIQGLPSGTNAFHLQVAGGLVDEDVWMGVAFSDGETGLLTFGPPDQGTSHDLAWLDPPGQMGNFGGVPPADFFLGVYASPRTPAVARTWGSVKAFYR